MPKEELCESECGRPPLPSNKREAKLDDGTIGRWYSQLTSEAFTDVLHPGSALVIDGNEDGDSRSIGSSNILKWKQKGARVVVVPREHAEAVAKASMPFLDNIGLERSKK